MLNFDDTGILDLTSDKVDVCHSTEFTDPPDFIIEFSESSNNQTKHLLKTIKNLQNNHNIWNLIKEENVSSKQIQVWIYYVLHHGLQKQATYAEKLRSLYGSHAYFLLLAQPGSTGNQFYHSVIFEKALNVFKMVSNAKSQNNQKKKPAQDLDEDEIVLTVNEHVKILDDFSLLLENFSVLLSSFSLKNRPNEIKLSIEALIVVVRSFSTSSSFSESCGLSVPDRLALVGLRSLVNTKHGSIEEIATLVFRLIMTTITLRHSTSSTGNLPRSAVVRAQTVVQFVKNIYRDHEEIVARPLWRLLQNLIAQCPDRLENRSHLSSFIVSILDETKITFYSNFLSWLLQFASHSKIGYRTGALSVISQIVVRPERTANENEELSNEDREVLSHKFLLQVVLSSISDISPKVRAKALLVLSSVMDHSFIAPALFTELVQGASIRSSPNKEATIECELGITPLEASENMPLLTPAVLNSVPVPSLCNYQLAESNLFSLLSKRLHEDKFAVRKNALLALETAICKGFIPATQETLGVLAERSRDPLLSIRKSAIQALNKVLTVYPHNNNVQHTWMSCLLPSIVDAETSLQEKAAQLIEDQILSKFDKEDSVVWNLLLILTDGKERRNRVYLQKVVKEWHNQGKLKSNFLKALTDSLQDDKKKAQAWMFLNLITLFTHNKSLSLDIVRHWKIQSEINNSISMQMDMIACLGQTAVHMSDEHKLFVLGILQKEIEHEKAPIQLIGVLFEAIYKIFKSQSSERKGCQQAMSEWCHKLLATCENSFSQLVMNQSQQQDHVSEETLINRLYVVGEAAQRSEDVSKRLLLSVQALLTSSSEEDPSSQPLSQFVRDGVSPSIRAHVILNLGRMCFRNEALAKKCVPALARELDSCEYEECRSNALAILTDLCVLQTQLVDPFLQEMATCLGDPSVIVRKHAVVLLSSLLQREYIKWKDSLLFKFLHVACDECEEVRSMARYFLLEQLLRGASVAGNFFYRNFVACLFYFNVYEGHNVHKYTKSPREKKLFDLSENFDKRMKIYEFILINMEDQHRINLTGRLCSDVLDAFVERTIPLTNETSNLLTDTLSVLCCKEIRLKCLRTREDNEMENEVDTNNPDEQLKAMQNAAKQKLILQTVKMNLVENIIPIIITLKNMLAEMKSPLLKNVMLYLKEVMKEYRKEVQVILSADKLLASEIEFDLKRFEREEEEARNIQKTAVVALDPLPPTPGLRPLKDIVTPATLKRKRRSMNIQAILRSAHKIVSDLPRSSRPCTPNSTKISETPAKVAQAATRAASTPQSALDPNFTFAARDISAIQNSINVSVPETPLLEFIHPGKAPRRRTWNITSPSRPTSSQKQN